ncbi:MAG: hypothetical protein HKN82_03880 [Akkermansiaceae bacterium]|nr:hypothetical protein [Akkermansiaceae bacterium]NNM29193.1 hypothetical protein [Akkermansiaceae bacterium]
MESRYRLRLYLLTALVLVGAGVLLTRLYEFQIEDRDFYLDRVPGNKTVTIREPGVRGEIVDRNYDPVSGKGVVLAENTRNYELVFNLEEIHRAWKLQIKQESGSQFVAGPISLPTRDSSKDIVKIVQESIEPRLRAHGIEPKYSPSAMQTHYLTHGGLVLFTFPVDLTFDQFSRLAEHNLEMPGVYVTVRPRRRYPYGTLACHTLGYLKQWEKGDIPDADKATYNHYLGDTKGINGIEATMNDVLTGSPGRRVLRMSEKGRILGEETLEYIPPRQGSRVELTIDARAQYLVENVLRKAGRAAAVVMDPNTGEVIAMASVPNYDPNEFIPSVNRAKYAEYRANRASPFTDRAISSFTPGSTFKLPTAIAGCMHGYSNRRYSCSGGIAYGARRSVTIRCWKREGHGTLDLASSIQRSCNTYFMDLATTLGTNRMVDAFQLVGFGKRTGIELPSESAGIVPGSNWWRREYRPGASMTPSLVAQLAIGQGDSQATPLQMCALVSCIANGGRYFKPRIVRRVIHPDRGVIVSSVPELRSDLLKEGLTAEQLEVIRMGMWKAANEPGGTAGRASLKEVSVAAKTGTAQTADLGIKSHNSWTVAFAPFDSPRYAIAVLVQNGKSGGRVCGPLVHMILRGLFASDGGLRLPLARMGEYEGHFDPIEQIDLPEGDLLPLAIDEEGETGEEAAEAEPEGAPVKVKPRTLPLPSITPEPQQ